MEEEVLRGWRRQGVSDRDWVKLKVIYFNEENKLCVKATDAFRAEQKENERRAAQGQKGLGPKERRKQDQKKFEVQKDLLNRHLNKHDKEAEDEAEPDCAVCMNLMIESCLLPCRHRFCIQCIRQHLSYSTACPICRMTVPDFFKSQFYMHNVDKEFQEVIKRKFPLEFEQQFQNLLKEAIPAADRYVLTLEIGQYFMGYQNPEKVYDYEQKCKTSEWTVFIRAKHASFRPFISQFIASVDFVIPKRAHPVMVEAPKKSETNV